MVDYASRLREAMIECGATTTSLAAAVGITYQAVKKAQAGKSGSFSAKNNAKAAAFLGVDSDWLASGRGRKHQDPQVEGVAHGMSLDERTMAPQHREWEHLMHGPLEPEFQTVVPDASMAPDVPKGARVIFVTGIEPVPGDFVLICDSGGVPYLREFKQHRPGRWEAHARNPAFLPLDSERDGLKVLAVFDGIRGRRGTT